MEVEDNGRGMDEETLSRIFELGFKAGEKSGQGIGLAVVKELTEDVLEGTIGVKSEVGGGTTFTLEFPVGAWLLLAV